MEPDQRQGRRGLRERAGGRAGALPHPAAGRERDRAARDPGRAERRLGPLHDVELHPDPPRPSHRDGPRDGDPESKLRIVAPRVGGGFGSKLQVYPEEALALAVAQKLRRPIKWVETRSENYLATHHGRDQVQFMEIAAEEDGKILGFRANILANMGRTWDHRAGHARPGWVPVLRRLHGRGLPREHHGCVHEHHAGRRVPGCGPAGVHERDRAGDRRLARRVGRTSSRSGG